MIQAIKMAITPTQTPDQAGGVPLWLDLKKEYIDDNFDRLVSYLSSCRTNAAARTEGIYIQTLGLLGERAAEEVREISERPLYADPPQPQELAFSVRLLGLWLLVAPPGARTLEAYSAMLLQLRLLQPKYTEQISKLSDALTTASALSEPGFSFDQIQNFLPEVFISHIADRCRTIPIGRNPKVFDGNGRAWLSASGMELTATGLSRADEIRERRVANLEVGASVRFTTPAPRLLKASDTEDMAAIHDFLDQFEELQREKRTPLPVRLHNYSEGDRLTVKVTGYGFDDEGTILVASEDPAYNRISGAIRFSRPSVAYYYTNMFWKNIPTGARLAVTLKNAEKGWFSMEREFTEFLASDIEECSIGKECCAKLTQTSDQSYSWLSDRGVLIETMPDPKYQRGDLAWLLVEESGKGPFLGQAYGSIVEPAPDQADEFYEPTIRKDCIVAFTESTPPMSVSTIGKPWEETDPLMLRLACRHHYHHQRNLAKPASRLRHLSVASSLATLLGEEENHSYLRFAESFLRAVVRFAAEKPLDDLTPVPDAVYADTPDCRTRLAIIGILKEYGKSHSPMLDRIASNTAPDNELLARLARLVQAANSVAAALPKPAVNMLRREIVRCLSLDTESGAELEADSRPYLGLEGQTAEFKTSIVYPPDNNMIADARRQAHTIMKTICGFMNSPVGGTLYIGVNDTGYAVGLERDMAYLNYHSFDSYARHIQDEVIRNFGREAMTYVHIDPVYGETVAAVRVEPHPYRVMELDDTAYIRMDRETREMTPRMKEETAAKKVKTDSNVMANMLNLQHAVFKRRRAILKDYASSNSGKISDRVVEPFKVLPDHGLALCYDCDSRTSKLFSLQRIGHVKVLETAWSESYRHEELEVDAFHGTGPQEIEVSLELDMTARNLMMEEYPLTKPDITPCKGNPNLWYYHGHVRSLSGLLRFYMGLAQHIKILSAPGLAEAAHRQASGL